jgi:hypothetical protein
MKKQLRLYIFNTDLKRFTEFKRYCSEQKNKLYKEKIKKIISCYILFFITIDNASKSEDSYDTIDKFNFYQKIHFYACDKFTQFYIDNIESLRSAFGYSDNSYRLSYRMAQLANHALDIFFENPDKVFKKYSSECVNRFPEIISIVFNLKKFLSEYAEEKNNGYIIDSKSIKEVGLTKPKFINKLVLERMNVKTIDNDRMFVYRK